MSKKKQKGKKKATKAKAKPRGTASATVAIPEAVKPSNVFNTVRANHLADTLLRAYPGSHVETCHDSNGFFRVLVVWEGFLRYDHIERYPDMVQRLYNLSVPQHVIELIGATMLVTRDEEWSKDWPWLGRRKIIMDPKANWNHGYVAAH